MKRKVCPHCGRDMMTKDGGIWWCNHCTVTSAYYVYDERRVGNVQGLDDRDRKQEADK